MSPHLFKAIAHILLPKPKPSQRVRVVQNTPPSGFVMRNIARRHFGKADVTVSVEKFGH